MERSEDLGRCDLTNLYGFYIIGSSTFVSFSVGMALEDRLGHKNNVTVLYLLDFVS
jgi:hypothetical protein